MRKKGTENRAYSDLREAAAKGDWGKAEGIFKGNPQYVRHSLTYAGETALQAAVLAGHSDFVKNLLSSSYMRKEDLERENGAGNTAFILAAKLGNIEFVLMMLEKNEDLVKFRDRNERLPVQVAASLGHKDIVKCLYNPTKAHFNNDEDCIRLLLTLIDNDIYDVALWMVEEFPSLAFCRTQKTDGNVETALHVLARKPLKTLNEFGILKRFYYRFISSIRVEKKKMDQEARKLLEVLWEKIVNQLDYNQISDLISKPSTLTSDAAKEGNFEFISILISNHPNAILNVDANNGYTLFHTAVEYRQEKIFELINENPSIKNVIVALKVGKEDNTILHLAAKLPPDRNRLNVVSGAALQMQQELRWFKEVEKFMPPSIAGAKNKKVSQQLYKYQVASKKIQGLRISLEKPPLYNNVKNVRSSKKPDGNGNIACNKASGSRFEILNEEVEVDMTEENQQPHENPTSTKLKAKGVLAEITNAYGSQSMSPGNRSKRITKKNNNNNDKMGTRKIAASYLKGNMSNKDSP
ncbi:hypothetical protein LWI28_028160 [Acer negundo]|uniref:Uncharacterized protein n=1 Tax=Acer negundo TaxID=4023 RepID=A0AAD5JRT0_ACENE|nr:hypothetical protein LWI28_028160 [Acer negundo]